MSGLDWRQPLEAKCMECSRISYADVSHDQMERYSRNEGYLQELFPELDPADRDIVLANHPRNISAAESIGVHSIYMCDSCTKGDQS